MGVFLAFMGEVQEKMQLTLCEPVPSHAVIGSG